MTSKKAESAIYGLNGRPENANDLLAAAKRAHAEGYRNLMRTPCFRSSGLPSAIHVHRNRLPRIVLIGGIVGALVGFGMQYYAAVIDYPLNVGGRLFNSWSLFVLITFELTILFAAFTAILAMFALNGLPQPYHPVFNVPRFALATRDRFFLCIETRDPKFDPAVTNQFLDSLKTHGVY
jgi:hypothetical protein